MTTITDIMGQEIVDVRRNKEAAENRFLHVSKGHPLVEIELDNGIILFASEDSEGNSNGTFYFEDMLLENKSDKVEGSVISSVHISRRQKRYDDEKVHVTIIETEKGNEIQVWQDPEKNGYGVLNAEKEGSISRIS